MKHNCIKSFTVNFHFKLEQLKNISNEKYEMFFKKYFKNAQLGMISAEYGGLDLGNVSREVTKTATDFLKKIKPDYDICCLKCEKIEKIYGEVITAYKNQVDKHSTCTNKKRNC